MRARCSNCRVCRSDVGHRHRRRRSCRGSGRRLAAPGGLPGADPPDWQRGLRALSPAAPVQGDAGGREAPGADRASGPRLFRPERHRSHAWRPRPRARPGIEDGAAGGRVPGLRQGRDRHRSRHADARRLPGRECLRASEHAGRAIAAGCAYPRSEPGHRRRRVHRAGSCRDCAQAGAHGRCRRDAGPAADACDSRSLVRIYLSPAPRRGRARSPRCADRKGRREGRPDRLG